MPPPTASAVPDLGSDTAIGSPFKKQRSSLPGFDESVRKKLGVESLGGGPRRESESAVQSAFSSGVGTVWPAESQDKTETIFEPGPVLKPIGNEMEDEL